MPTLSVNPFEEAPLHLASVFGGRPLPRVAFASGNDGGADPQDIATKDVIVFGVVRRVAKHSIEIDKRGGILHRGDELWRVLGRSHADVGARPKVGLPVADDGQLGPVKAGMSLLPLSPDVVPADVAALQPRSIGDAFGFTSEEL